jgi:hypothetical protein
MAKEQSSVKERQRVNLDEPRRYKVTIYNDDFTTMEFVVKVLVEVFFKNADDGLSPWQDIEGFEIAGADGVFKTAKATLNEGHKSIMVSSSEVPEPVAVRYCFKSFQIGNLKNVHGLPVVPFRTDK